MSEVRELIGIVGWDIGGANVKAAGLGIEAGTVQSEAVISLPFELWRDKDRLPDVLRAAIASVAPGRQLSTMGVTMTAELADIFATKREGVSYILRSVQTAFPDCACYALNLAGEFMPVNIALTQPLEYAATNWIAMALWLAGRFTDCLLVDVGSTTTDIVPILGGQLVAAGRNDLERLASGELVYTGALRTNLAAIVQSVPVSGRLCRVASEYFAISGDIHLILGHLKPDEYTCPTPDGRPPTVDSARGRLARLVCADIEMLPAAEIDELAGYIYLQQLRKIEEGILQVISRQPRLRDQPVITLGMGAFLAAAAARRLKLATRSLENVGGPTGSAMAPCLAVAHLLAARLEAGTVWS